MKCYHNCEVCVLRNGKGSRDGIEIPERPARYVEEKEEVTFVEPILTTPFYMDRELEDAPVREKIGGADSGEGGKFRRHRGGRRRNKSDGDGQQAKAEQPKQSQQSKPKSGGNKKDAKSRPAKAQGPKQPKPAPQPKGESKAAEGGADGEVKRRHRPHHRGGRRRNKGGGEGGSAPKAE